MLQVEDLSIALDGSETIVDKLSFTLETGKVTCLIGESGCGKSVTALSCIRLLADNFAYHKQTKISLDNKNLLNLPECELQAIRGNEIAMIFQDPMTCLNPVMTIGEQLSATDADIIAWLKKVRISDPDKIAKSYPHQLSGGMKQRVLIAMALSHSPKLLIADEPTTALDVTTQAQILHLLKELQIQQQLSVLLITHDLSIAKYMADNVALMYLGQIIEYTDASKFFTQCMHPYAHKLLSAVPESGKHLPIIQGSVPKLGEKITGCKFANRCEFASSSCQAMPELLEINKNHLIRCHHPQQLIKFNKSEVKQSQSTHEVILKVNDLQVKYSIGKSWFRKSELYVVNGVDFELYKGQTLAIVGESGCGKSTLAKSIALLQKTSVGDIFYKQQNIRDIEGRKLRANIQMIFQDPFSALDPKMMIFKQLELGLKYLQPYLTKRQREIKIDNTLVEVGLDPSVKYRYPHEFSGGQRQRICIAKALSVDPELVICDEPTSALDLSVQAQILNLLKSLQQKHKLSYLFISHDLAVVSYIADYLSVMYLGKIVEFGKTKDVLANPKHPYTRDLFDSVITLETQELKIKNDELPSKLNIPSGCSYHPRCTKVLQKCKFNVPLLSDKEGVKVACHLYDN